MEVSDSEDDNQVRPKGRKKVAKELRYSDSPSICPAIKQDKVIVKNTTHPQWTTAELRSKLRQLDALHPSWCATGM